MATIDKLNYLNETKQQIKSALNTNFNSQIQDSDTFRSYVSKIQNIYNNWTKVTDVGTELTLNNTKNGKMLIALNSNTLSQDNTPSPSSPQDIHIITGDNNIKIANSDDSKEQNYPISLGTLEYCKIGDYADSIKKNTGKNLFDKDNANILNTALSGSGLGTNSPSTYRTVWIPCKANTTYTVSKKYDATKNRFAVGYSYVTPTYSLSDVYGYSYSYSASSLTITTDSSAKYLIAYIWISGGTETYQDMIDSVQIEFGNTATEFEPYGTGEWYLHKEIGKVVLNGSETYYYSSVSSQYYRIRTKINDKITNSVNSNKADIFSNYFKAGIWNSGIGQGESVCELNGDNSAYFIINGNQLSDTSTNEKVVESFKTWLSTNNTTIYYILATPTNTKITSTNYPTLYTQLQNLDNALSYQNQTNISQTNDDLAFSISASALMKGGN